MVRPQGRILRAIVFRAPLKIVGSNTVEVWKLVLSVFFFTEIAINKSLLVFTNLISTLRKDFNLDLLVGQLT